MRLFLCDDNHSHRALVKAVLSTESDLQVIGEGFDAESSIARAREVQPDVILLDVRMPATDGFGALPGLREAAPGARIIFLSTAWTAADERRALDAGAAAYVQKPHHILDLPSLLRGALGQAGALVEQLVRNWHAGERRRAYAALHHDVVFRPPCTRKPLQGIAEMQRFFDGLPPAERAARVTELTMLESGQQVVLLGRAEIPRHNRQGEYVEHIAPAWRLEVREGKVASITTYPSWDEAQAAADLTPGARGGEPRRTLVRDGLWRLMRRLVPAVGL